MTLRVGLPSDAQGLKILNPDGTWSPAIGTERVENLVTNPSFEAVQPGDTVLRTNYILNPSLEYNSVQWVNIGNAAKTVESVNVNNAYTGNTILRVTRKGEGSLGHGAMTDTLEPGFYKVGLWVRGTATGYVRLYVEGSATKDLKYSNGAVGLDFQEWRLIWGVIETTTEGNLKPGFLGGDGNDRYVEADGAFCFRCGESDRDDPSDQFFHGDSTDELGWTYEWVGIPGESISVAKAAAVEVYRNLVTNPSFEATNGVVEVRRNLTHNPRVATSTQAPTGTIGWRTGRWFGPNGGAGNYTWVADANDGPSGLGITSYLRKTWTASPSYNGDTGFDNTLADTFAYPVTVGKTYTISSYIRSSASGKEQAVIRVYWSDSSGVYLSQLLGTNYNPVAGAWTRLEATVSVPSGATHMRVVSDVRAGTPWVPGDTLDGTGLLVEESNTLGTYFDGSTSASGDFSYAWVGTANDSHSVQKGALVNGGYSTTRILTYQTKDRPRQGTSAIRAVVLDNTNFAQAQRIQYAIDAVGGRAYTILSYARRNGSGGMGMQVQWYDINSTPLSNSTGPQLSNTSDWTELRFTATAPAGATRGLIWIGPANGVPSVGDTFDVDTFLVTEGIYTGTYFDGSSASSGDFTYAWTGIPHASRSVQQAPSIDTRVYGNGTKLVTYQSISDSGKMITVMNSNEHQYIQNTLPAGVNKYTVIMEVKTPMTYIRTVDRSGPYGTLNTTISHPVTANQWTKLVIPRVRANPTVSSNFDIGYELSHGLTGPFSIRSLAIVPGEYAGDYFDGNTSPDINYIYRWSGTPHASTSIGA